MTYIRVAVDVPLRTLFDYRAPHVNAQDIGCRIKVPFGRKHVVGLILSAGETPSIDASKVRPAGPVLRDMPALPADIMDLLEFCSRYYHHPIGEVAAAALPSRLRTPRELVERKRQDIAVTVAGRTALTQAARRTPALARLLARLAQAPAWSAEELGPLTPPERRALKQLRARGWVEGRDAGVGSVVTATRSVEEAERPPLTEEQRSVVETIRRDGARFRVWLVHGVTGSGKTEIYLNTMEDALRAGRQVLLLVPEIGLTPQLESRVRKRFARWHTVTMHSGLAAGERARHWIDAHAGRAHIVLGTRSAIFAPLPSLGLIVVDEEHDASYKQIEGMRYSARDLAVWRARRLGIPVVLGSATPCLETYHAALGGRYSMLSMRQRATQAPLPEIRIAAVANGREAQGLGREVREALQIRLARGEQSLVFINRRGYAPVLVCSACGWAPGCHRCSARLVLHRPRARMMCHHCGHNEAIPVACTSCGNQDLHPLGYGTQRIETALETALPDARIMRVDRDTTRARDAWPQMRTAVARGEVDILVGTQLLAKGHDFPGLALVCVLNADQSLYSTDFRAAEHLFAQLTQVAGRAGRGSITGEVIVQTQFPAHPLYRAVQAHDFAGFARVLLEERRQAGFPPFVHQAVLRAEGSTLADAIALLTEAAALAGEMAQGVDVFEPTPATMERLKGQARAQLLVQSGSRSRLHAFLEAWTDRLTAMRAYGARWAIDVDPMDV